MCRKKETKKACLRLLSHNQGGGVRPLTLSLGLPSCALDVCARLGFLIPLWLKHLLMALHNLHRTRFYENVLVTLGGMLVLCCQCVPENPCLLKMSPSISFYPDLFLISTVFLQGAAS
jgi:hypothetical protein